MDYFRLRTLRAHNAAWHLLRADHAPFILAFLHAAFIAPNRRAIAYVELVTGLDSFLKRLRETEGAEAFPRSARDYLDDWSRGDLAFVRKYYPRGTDDAEIDLTPATEKALQWAESLEQKQFVGTESRLQTLLRLLQELVELTDTNVSSRVATLTKQKADIEREIERLTHGGVLTFDATQVKERFFEIEDAARQLLSDFRQVEENFRVLDRTARETIATSNEAKGVLLDRIFGDQDAIGASDQGKSFRAFWSYLMSPQRQHDMREWVGRIYALDAVATLTPSDFVRELRGRLLDAGEKVQRTSSLLVEQLRRYLDAQVWLENRRVMQLIADVERLALAVRDNEPSAKAFTTIDDPKPGIELPMVRGLFRPQPPVVLIDDAVELGAADFDVDVLYDRHHVDLAQLEQNIALALAGRSQASLAEITERFPLTLGLAELVGYLHLAGRIDHTAIDRSRQQHVAWTHADGRRRRATIPLVVFTR